MKKLIIVTAIAVAIAGAGLLVGCGTAPPNATPAEKKQAAFDAACKYGGGVWQLAKPLAAVPSIDAKLGDSGRLAVKSLDTAINVTCHSPLDVNDQDAVIQRIYDLGGQVMALVLAATTG